MPDELLEKENELLSKGLEDKEPSTKKPGNPFGSTEPLQMVESLIKVISTAKIGKTVFDNYAEAAKLWDHHRLLFRLFLVASWIIDTSLAIVLILIVTALLAGIAFSVLRGLNAVQPVIDIVKFMAHLIGR